MRRHIQRIVSAGMALCVFGLAQAAEVNLTAERDSVSVLHHGKLVKVERIQDTNHVVDPMWGKTSRKCPPFCLQPNVPVEGVTNVGEVEVFDFMENKVNTEAGMIIDARLPSWHKRGTIPGSINIPFTVFDHEPTHPDVIKALKLLGGEPRENVGDLTRALEKQMAKLGISSSERTAYWDFSKAKDILLWCNGPWCGQSPRAIRALAALGYPTEKIFYYRGGMQTWKIMGLTVLEPDPKYMLFAEDGGGE